MFDELLKEAVRCQFEYDRSERDAFRELHEYCSRPNARANPDFVNIPRRDLLWPTPENGKSLMHMGCSHPALLKLMLALGGDVNVLCMERFPPLVYAMTPYRPRSIEAMRILLDKGADTKNIWSRAMYYSFYPHRNVVLLLIQRGLMTERLLDNIPPYVRWLIDTQIVMVALCTPLVLERFHKRCWLPLDCIRLLYIYL
jgi:hypothetical protein